MRICLLCNEYPPGAHGGIGTHTQLLGRALVGSGHEVRVLGVYPRDSCGRAYEVDEGVRVWRLRSGASRAAKTLARYRLFRIVARWSRAGRIDLVEVPDWEGWVAGWPPLPVPVVARLNGSAIFFAAEMGEPAPRLTAALERASLRRADALCAASRYVAERTAALFDLSSEPAAILHNAVEIRRAAPASGRVPGRVVFSGRLIPKKGVEPLVRAWARVREQVPAAELHLFGRDGPRGRKGSMRVFLERLSGDATNSRVVFHDHVSRDALGRALDTASAAVFPSFVEAFAFAPLEAMAAGCATISSRRGSGPELIVDGRDGLLVDPADPDGIAKALVRVLTDGDLRRRIGAAGRRRIETAFSLPILKPRNEAFYRSAMARFGAARIGAGANLRHGNGGTE